MPPRWPGGRLRVPHAPPGPAPPPRHRLLPAVAGGARPRAAGALRAGGVLRDGGSDARRRDDRPVDLRRGLRRGRRRDRAGRALHGARRLPLRPGEGRAPRLAREPARRHERLPRRPLRARRPRRAVGRQEPALGGRPPRGRQGGLPHRPAGAPDAVRAAEHRAVRLLGHAGARPHVRGGDVARHAAAHVLPGLRRIAGARRRRHPRRQAPPARGLGLGRGRPAGSSRSLLALYLVARVQRGGRSRGPGSEPGVPTPARACRLVPADFDGRQPALPVTRLVSDKLSYIYT